tara:strand:+ start:55 stop:246 length:192 start_codon:yes stop_codon:yes gene_type:complete
MINKYHITESAIIKRVYSVEANSKEEAELKHNKGLSITDSYNDEDVDGSHQIEEIEFIEEVKE